MDRDELNVNLADPDDVRAKLPQACERLRDTERLLEEVAGPLRRQLERWQSTVKFMELAAGFSDQAAPEPERSVPETNGNGDVQPLELVVSAVERAGRKIRARDVRTMLADEGHMLSADSVSNALYYAATGPVERIWKPPAERGYYAPLSLKPPTLDESDSSTNSNQDAVQR